MNTNSNTISNNTENFSIQELDECINSHQRDFDITTEPYFKEAEKFTIKCLKDYRQLLAFARVNKEICISNDISILPNLSIRDLDECIKVHQDSFERAKEPFFKEAERMTIACLKDYRQLREFKANC